MKYIYHTFILLISFFKLTLSQFSYDDDKSLRELADINREMKNCQNNYRSIHNSPNLIINPELVHRAQDEAIRLSKLQRLEFGNVYYRGAKLGSILWSKSINVGNIAREACDSWYSQNSKHNYYGDWNEASGSFSQLVWKSSLEIGTGRAVASNGWVFLVTLYYQGGNVMGQFKYNVFPPTGGSFTTVTTNYQNNYNNGQNQYYQSGSYESNNQVTTVGYQSWDSTISSSYQNSDSNFGNTVDNKKSKFQSITPNSQKKAKLIEYFNKMAPQYGLN